MFRNRLRIAFAVIVGLGAAALLGSCSDDGPNILVLPSPVPGASLTAGPGFTALKTYTVVYESTITAAGQTTRTIHTLVQDPPRGLNHIQVLNEYAGQTWFIYDGTQSIACSKGRSDAGSCRVLSTNTASSSAVPSVGASSATPPAGSQQSLGSRTIAGRTAACFAYPATASGSPAGPSEMCFDAEWGVMLYVKTITRDMSSELLATSVLPTADPSAFIPPFPIVP